MRSRRDRSMEKEAFVEHHRRSWSRGSRDASACASFGRPLPKVAALTMLASVVVLLSSHPVVAIRRLPSDLPLSRAHNRDHAEEDGLVGDGGKLPLLDGDNHESEHRRRLLLLASHQSHATNDLLEQQQQQQQQQQQRRAQQQPQINPADHLVTNLPLLNSASFPSKHYAGHMPASSDPNDKKLFYWLFEPAGMASGVTPADPSIPLVIWLNGGPGCSSMDGLFLENGPFRLVADGSNGWRMDVNPTSWHTMPAWVLYVDQPVGTGLSFTKKKKYCKSDLEVNQDFHYFLMELLKTYGDTFLAPGDNGFGQSVLNRKLYFSGESHAGHYIPSMMSFILKRNDDTSNPPGIIIPLAGAAIGNGWVDPYNQYAAATAAYGMGLIDLAQKAHFDKMETQCQAKMDGGNLDASVCFRLLDDIVGESHGGSSSYRVSQYDNRKWEAKNAPRTFPPGHKDVESYLGGWDKSSPKMGVNYKTVLDAIHASESIEAKQRYQECTDPPFDALRHQDGLGVIDDVVQILDHPTKPRMLFFNGMNDLICNHAGNERFLDIMPWRHAKEWTLAKRYVWNGPLKGSKSSPVGPAGYLKEYDNLMFLKVPNSGHMVPMDQPEISLAMMRVLAGSGSFRDSEQNVDRSDPRDGIGSCEPCPTCAEVPAYVPPPQAGIGGGPGMTPGSSPGSASFSASNSASGDGSEGVEQEGGPPVLRSLIAGGWMGAVAALAAVALVSVWRRRRQQQRGKGQVMRVDGSLVGDEDDDYEFDLQLEMSNGKMNGGGRGVSEYRDDPPDSAAGGRRGSGGRERLSSRSSSSVGEML